MGKGVRLTKGKHRNDYRTIRLMVGNGHARGWVVKFDNDVEIQFHSKSLEVQDDYHDFETEDEKGNEPDGTKFDHGELPAPVGDEMPPPDQQDEFNDDWILQVCRAM